MLLSKPSMRIRSTGTKPTFLRNAPWNMINNSTERHFEIVTGI